jgi:hypothetical protein
MYDEENQKRETRRENHLFLKPVWVWYSASVDERDGHGIYETSKGVKIKGTAHTDIFKNPYPKELKDVKFVGSAVSLFELVDVSPKKPSSSHYNSNNMTCDVINLVDMLYHQVIIAMGLAHED